MSLAELSQRKAELSQQLPLLQGATAPHLHIRVHRLLIHVGAVPALALLTSNPPISAVPHLLCLRQEPFRPHYLRHRAAVQLVLLLAFPHPNTIRY